MVEDSSNNETKETTDNEFGKLDVSLQDQDDRTPVHAKSDDLLQGTNESNH